MDAAAQRNQAVPKGAGSLDPLDLQSLAGSTGGAAQSLVLLDLNVQRHLRCDGGLSRLGGLFLQTYTTTKSQGSNTNGTRSAVKRNLPSALFF